MSWTVLSTRELSIPQKNRIINANMGLVSYDAIKTVPLQFQLPSDPPTQLVFTSKNGVLHFLKGINITAIAGLKSIPCYCVGNKTKQLLQKNGFSVLLTANNAHELSLLIPRQNHENLWLIVGKIARPELATQLAKLGIPFQHLVVYDTVHNFKKFSQSFDAILFYSPSGVTSFSKHNNLKNQLSFCIGTTTAQAAKDLGASTVISSKTTVESVLVAAISYFKKHQHR